MHNVFTGTSATWTRSCRRVRWSTGASRRTRMWAAATCCPCPTGISASPCSCAALRRPRHDPALWFANCCLFFAVLLPSICEGDHDISHPNLERCSHAASPPNVLHNQGVASVFRSRNAVSPHWGGRSAVPSPLGEAHAHNSTGLGLIAPPQP